IDFVNALMKEHIESGVIDQGVTATQTINFIDDQLLKKSIELSTAEDRLRDFKKSNGAIELSDEAKTDFDELKKIDEEVSEIEIEQKVLDYIKNYVLANKKVDLIAPSQLQINDLTLSAHLTKYNQYLEERQAQLTSNTEKSLSISDLDGVIEGEKQSILDNLKTNYEGRNLKITELIKAEAQIKEKMKGIPDAELEFLGLQRNFTKSQAIFDYLQQRQAEAEIAKAAIVPNEEIVDSARTDKPVSPDTSTNNFIALFAGLIIPSVIIYLRGYLDNSIQNKSQLETLTNIPILGTVGHNYTKTNLVILNHPKSVISEAFRSIRTNLQFLGNFDNNSGKATVLLISSIVGGEGKTFSTINLSSILAFAHKKVILLGMDLRKPKVHLEFDLDNKQGITTHLIGQIGLDEIIRKTPIKNLDLINAGPIPPNPSELLLSQKMAE